MRTATTRFLHHALLGAGLAVCQPQLAHAQALPRAAEQSITQWTQKFAGPLRGDYEQALVRAQPWANMIAAKLEATGLPGALVYLPIVESAYSPWAESRAHAMGLWQLMPGTGRDLGLEISSELDERRDPWKSTDAAIRHLRALLRMQHGDWLLTLAAYNAGAGTIKNRALRVPAGRVPQGGAYWTLTPFLPKETQHYVPQLLAAYRVGSSPEEYGIRVPASPALPALVRVSVPPRTSLALIGKVWGMSADQVWAWNPALQRRETPNRWYALVLPADRAEERQRMLIAARTGARTVATGSPQ